MAIEKMTNADFFFFPRLTQGSRTQKSPGGARRLYMKKKSFQYEFPPYYLAISFFALRLVILSPLRVISPIPATSVRHGFSSRCRDWFFMPRNGDEFTFFWLFGVLWYGFIFICFPFLSLASSHVDGVYDYQEL